ncbi:MAG: RsmD family RNA methyltransferase, partial [Campylobacter hyointestinalis]
LYIDPPFDIRDGFEDIYKKVWDMLTFIDKSKICLVVIEHISSYDTPNSCGEFIKFKSRKFGKTTLSYYQI